MTRTIRVLAIPANDSQPTVVDVRADLDGMQTAIGGGSLEALTLDPDRDVTMYLDEEGKIKQLPVNDLATRLAEHHYPGFTRRDNIAGDVVITSVDEAGNDTDVPTDIVNQVTQLGPQPGAHPTTDADHADGPTPLLFPLDATPRSWSPTQINVERALWAETTLRVFAELTGQIRDLDTCGLTSDILDQIAGDLVCDLMHLCARTGADPHAIVTNGTGRFHDEYDGTAD